MNWIIRSFSGTGNTARAAKLAAALLSASGRAIDEASILDDRPFPPEGDLLVAFPVYSWAPPAIMARWLRALPRGDEGGTHRLAAVLAVDGGDGRLAAERARSILERKGWKVLASGRAGYPVNWRQMSHVPSPAEAEPLLDAGDAQVRGFVAGLLEGRAIRYRAARPNAFLDGFLPLLFPLIARRLLGKLWYADGDCVSCGICRDACPAGTILMGKGQGARPFWKADCENCNRCVNLCPRGAIVTSIGRAIVINILPLPLAAAGIASWFRWTVPALAGTGLIGLPAAIVNALACVAIYTLCAILVAGPLDRWLIRPLQNLPGISRFMAWTFTKGWGRYVEPGFKPPLRKAPPGGDGGL